jgi:hypothetical protein
MFFRNDMLMGGNNGFTDFKFILGQDVRSPATQRGLFSRDRDAHHRHVSCSAAG